MCRKVNIISKYNPIYISLNKNSWLKSVRFISARYSKVKMSVFIFFHQNDIMCSASKISFLFTWCQKFLIFQSIPSNGSVLVFDGHFSCSQSLWIKSSGILFLSNGICLIIEVQWVVKAVSCCLLLFLP